MVSWAELRGVVLALAGFVLVILAVSIRQPGLPGEQLLQSLQFHFAAAGLGLALVLAVMGARWRALALALVVSGMAFYASDNIFEFQARRVAHAGAPLTQFRFLSFNVMADNPRAEELVEVIIADPPDVMLVMESLAIRPYLDRLTEVFPYQVGCDGSDSCDISLFSRFPFEDQSLAQLSPLWANRFVTGRISVDGQSVTVVGLHLTKPYYGDIAETELRRASRMMERIEGPVVVAGDFNAASWSDAVAAFGRAQNLAPGPVQPATWPVRLGPLGVPIDNMFTRGSAQIISLESGESIGSNHRPLWATVGLYGAD